MKTDTASLQWEKVHVFISSTFNDMHAERDYLVKRVFPELQDWCERRKLRLVDIDLRWGVTEQDATHNKNVVKVCLSRIDDCRPFFLCFIGQRRGWVPKEGEVSDETFAAFPDLRSFVGAASVTEMEILHALINPFHQSQARDPEKPAEHYERAKYSFFYLRDPSYLDQLPNDPSMLRETYTNEWVEDAAELQRHDSALKKWREQEIPASNRPFHLYEAKWDPTATTPELMIPIQCPSAEPQNRVRWQQQWQKAGVAAAGLNIAEDVLEASKAAEFNTRLSAGRLSDFQCAEAPFSETIIRELQAAIAERFPEHSEVAHEDELQKEIDQQEQFLFTASEGFIEREGDFAELDNYVESHSNKLFVLTAAGGMGKSTLLANWIDRYRSRIEDHADHSIHFRFIGQSDGTTTVYSLLRLLLSEVKEVAQKIDEEIPLDPVKLRNEWQALLEAIGKRGKTVIVIDALNQLDSGLTDVGWLPQQLPDKIKLIVSFKREDKAAERFYKRFNEGNQVKLAEVKPFADLDDRRQLVEAYLKQYLKELDEQQLETLINLHGAENPLYLKVVLSELRVFGAYGNLAAKIRSDFGDTPVSAFAQVLKRLETDPAYSPIDPKKAVPLLFGLFAHARRGLSVDELTSLFIQALELADTAQSLEAAADTVNLFLRQVRSFLARREGRYDFFFESFKSAAQQCYVAKSDEEPVSKRSYQEWHRLLANYFKSLPTWQDAAPSSPIEQARQPTCRKVAELPHHLIQAEQWEGVEEALCDLDFIAAKCAARRTFDLVTDFHSALESLPMAKEGLRDRREHEERATRWTSELIAYSNAWSERLDLISRGQPLNETEPMLPEIPGSCRMWTDREMANEGNRIVQNPTQLDLLTAFADFVRAECYPLLQFGYREGFVVQHAWNHAPGGPVHAAAREVISRCASTLLVRRWPPDAVHIPKPALLSTLEGHSDLVNCVRMTPDGRRAVSGSHDKTLRVWDVESGAGLRTLEGHTDAVSCVSVTPDGRIAVSGSGDETLRVWELDSGACLLTLTGHSDWVGCVSVTPGGRRAVSGSRDKTIRLWNLENGACLRTLEGHADWILCVSATPDGRRAISGSWDKTLRVWDLENGACLHTLEGHTDWVLCVGVTPDGRFAISGSADNTLRLWDLESGACLQTLEGHNSGVTGVCAQPDSRRALSASFDKMLRVWDLETGACLRTLAGHSDTVYCVSGTSDGRRAVSGSRDKTLRIWNLESGVDLGRVERHNDSVLSVSLTPDGRRAISGSGDSTLRIWDLESGNCIRTLEGHSNWVLSVSVTPNSARVVSWSRDDTLRVWDLESGHCLLTADGNYRSISVTADGRRAVLGTVDNTLRVWDLEIGACLHTLTGHSDSVKCVSVTPDGRRAVSGSDDKTLRVWNLEKASSLRTVAVQSDWVWRVSITPDGRRAVSGGWDKTLRIWDLETGACLRSLKGHTSWVKSLRVTPDGRWAVSGSDGDGVRVWDLESGKCHLAVKGLSGGVDGLSVSADGRSAVSGSDDKTLRVWDLERGQCVGVGAVPMAIVSVALDSRSNTICAGSRSGEVHIRELRGVEPGPDLKPDMTAEAYEQLLYRGLEFTRREKSDNHDETLAHLVALAVHLQNMGKSDEAREFAKERDQLISLRDTRETPNTE